MRELRIADCRLSIARADKVSIVCSPAVRRNPGTRVSEKRPALRRNYERGGRFAWAMLFSLISLPGPAVGAPAAAASAAQTTAMESARQEMVEAQLGELIGRFDELLADLASNQGVGADVTKIAGGLRQRLATVKQVRLGHARKLIDQAVRGKGPAGPALAEARNQIELAARELGSLLLQAGVSQACEVFATELREIISREESLLAGGAAKQAEAAGASESQRGLAERVSALVGEIQAMHDAPGDALAAVRLARARKLVEAGQVVAEMKAAAEAMANKSAGAPERQGKALHGLRQGLLKLRPDAKLEELVRARGVLKEMEEAQKSLRTTMTALGAESFAAQKTTLRLRQESAVRALGQLDGSSAGSGQGILEIDAPLAAARKAAADAAGAIEAGDAAAAAAAQTLVEAALLSGATRLGEQIARLGALGDTHRRMLESADRLKQITEIRDRSEQVKNSAYDAATAGKPLTAPAAAQEQLAQEVAALATNLPAGNFASSLRRSLRKAAGAMDKSAKPMKANQLGAAVGELGKAEQALREAMEIGKRELGVLEKLWLFRQASADLRVIRQSLEDLEAEQTDLRKDVDAAVKDARTVLDMTSAQAMLARALGQVQENAGSIREAAAMKEPLDLAMAAMTDASGLLEKDQGAGASESQKKAIAALQAAAAAAANVIRQIELIVTEIDATSELSSRAMDLLQRQIVLRETTEEAAEGEFPRLVGEQDILLGETDVLTGLSVAPKAASAFKTAVEEMKGAIKELKAPARDPAVEHQKKAEAALKAGILALDEYILSLMQLLESGAGMVTYIGAFDGLTAILLLATEQRELRELTLRTPDAALPTHVEKQAEFKQRADAIAQMPNILSGQGRITGWEHVEAAARAMVQAVKTLKASVKNETITHQQTAEKELRIAFAMNVVELIMALQPPPPPSSAMTPMTIRDAPAPISLDHWFEFSRASPEGKLPTGNKSEWNSLVDRERAALNENFARELPLEFRKLLKDYYEAMAK